MSSPSAPGTRGPRPTRLLRALVVATSACALSGCLSDNGKDGDPGHAGARFNSFSFTEQEEQGQRDSKDAWVFPDRRPSR